jgi:phosphoglycolate phosphatase-like HAD superfamily hydrolase
VRATKPRTDARAPNLTGGWHGSDSTSARVRAPHDRDGRDRLLPELTGLDPDSGEAKRIGETRSELFLERELPTLRATPGARALLEHMFARGFELVVATSAKSDEVSALLEQAGVSDLPLGEAFSTVPALSSSSSGVPTARERIGTDELIETGVGRATLRPTTAKSFVIVDI